MGATVDYLFVDRKGKHLSEAERGKIAILHAQGYTPYKIGKITGRASNTIRNELKRGTTTVIKGYFEKTVYLPECGQAVYKRHMEKCGCDDKREKCQDFLIYVEEQVKVYKRSLDSIVGRVRREGLFTPEEMVCTTTLYTYVDRGYLKIKNIDLPEKVSRKKDTGRPKRDRKHKRLKGRSIEERPAVVDDKEEFGHWEIDTVIGKQEAGNVLMTLTERKTKREIIRKINNKGVKSVAYALRQIEREYPYFNEVFKSITTDNGTEFSRLYEFEFGKGTRVYYAHPYSSYERPLNESTNRIIRRFIPKGREIARYSHEKISRIENWVNTLPRRSLGYATAEEMFREELRIIEERNQGRSS